MAQKSNSMTKQNWQAGSGQLQLFGSSGQSHLIQYSRTAQDERSWRSGDGGSGVGGVHAASECKRQREVVQTCPRQQRSNYQLPGHG